MMEFVFDEERVRDVFVVKYEAEINWFMNSESFEYPYKEQDILSVCSTAQKAKEHITKYARELVENLEKEGYSCIVDNKNEGWWIQIEVPCKLEWDVRSNIFVFTCINFDLDHFDDLVLDDKEA